MAPDDRARDSSAGRLRILYVIDKMGQDGGAQTHLAALATGLPRDRFSTEIVCVERTGTLGGRLREGGYPISQLDVTRLYRPSALSGFVRLVARLRRWSPAVVHTYLSAANVLGAAAARTASVPHLITTRRDTGFCDSPAMARALKWTSRWADAVVAVSGDAARVARERDNVDPARLVVIPNGIDMERFQPRGRREAVRESLGLAPAQPLVLTVAHLTHIKGIDVLLEAAAQIRAAVPSAVFVVTGGGPERERLLERAASLGLAADFRLVGPSHQVPELLEAADLFVLPSRSEGQPNSLLEAMAMGLPVVATRVGGVPEMLADGLEGLLVDADDAPALARACLGVLGSPELGQRLGRQGRDRVARDYDVRHMVGQYERLYERVAGVRSAHHAPALLGA